MEEELDTLDINSEEEETSIKANAELEENVKKYVIHDDIIKQKEDELRQLKKQRTLSEKIILESIDDDTIIELTDGKLKKNKIEPKLAINVDIIREVFKDKIKEGENIEDLIKLIDEKRNSTETKTVLKRVNNKKKIQAKKKPVKKVKNTKHD